MSILLRTVKLRLQHHMIKTLPASVACPVMLFEIITTLEHDIQFLSHLGSQPGTPSYTTPNLLCQPVDSSCWGTKHSATSFI